MKTLHFSITLRAPREKVWRLMLGTETYPKWTDAFTEGSYFEGSWDKGAKIRFLSPAGEGMSSEIVENRREEFVSIRHLGYIKDGAEDFDSPEVRAWLPSYENYTFAEAAGGTELKVDLDSPEEYEGMFAEMWPKALGKLKELCEA
jgi:uncharacterized protein YndB with AHSA1/START domain